MTGAQAVLRFAPESKRVKGAVACWTTAQATFDSMPQAQRPRPRRGSGAEGHHAWRFRTEPAKDNLEALAFMAFCRKGGEAETYSVAVDCGIGGLTLSGAVVRRLRMRAGLARPRLEFEYEIIGAHASPSAGFKIHAVDRGAFSFDGVSALLDGDAADLKEFSLSVNNNLIVAHDSGGAYLVSGRQEVTGYVCVSDRWDDLVDGGTHSFEVTLPAPDGVSALISAAELEFVWLRRIESVMAGPLEVLYFEGAHGGLEAGVNVGLLAKMSTPKGRARAEQAPPLPETISIREQKRLGQR